MTLDDLSDGAESISPRKSPLFGGQKKKSFHFGGEKKINSKAHHEEGQKPYQCCAECKFKDVHRVDSSSASLRAPVSE